MAKKTLKELETELAELKKREAFLKATVGKLGTWKSDNTGKKFLTVKLKGVKSIMLNVDAYNELVDLVDSEFIKQALIEYQID